MVVVWRQGSVTSVGLWLKYRQWSANGAANLPATSPATSSLIGPSWSRMKIQIKCLDKEGDIDIVLLVRCDGCCECDTF